MTGALQLDGVHVQGRYVDGRSIREFRELQAEGETLWFSTALYSGETLSCSMSMVSAEAPVCARADIPSVPVPQPPPVVIMPGPAPRKSAQVIRACDALVGQGAKDRCQSVAGSLMHPRPASVIAACSAAMVGDGATISCIRAASNQNHGPSIIRACAETRVGNSNIIDCLEP